MFRPDEAIFRYFDCFVNSIAYKNTVTVHQATKAYGGGKQGPKGYGAASGGSSLLPIYFWGKRARFLLEMRLGGTSIALGALNKEDVQRTPGTEA
jgi:hypothetical protein